MTVKELKALIEKLPDEAYIVCRGDDGYWFPYETDFTTSFVLDDQGNTVEVATLELS